MKIEITPLDARLLLAFLRAPGMKEFAIEHYAVGAVTRLLAALEARS